MSNLAQTWWNASGQHVDSELPKLFHFHIQDGCHGSHVECLQMTSTLEIYARLNRNLAGGIRL